MAALCSRWTWRMAWRDSRASRRRLLLYSTSIVLGIAALVAIGSFGAALDETVNEQAKTLLGADLVISSRQEFTAADEELFRELGGEQSRQITLPSMVSFPGTNGGSRLVQVRALAGGFPFHGRLETVPESAASDFRRGTGALVEESLLIQYQAGVGDVVKLGQLETRVAGILRKVPGETVLFATIAPRVFIAMSDLDRTGLLREGSLAQYRVFFRFPDGTDVEKLVAAIRPRLDEQRLAHTTVEKRKREFGRSLDNLRHFLNLAGFVALLLGGVGVASAIHVHVKQKLDTVAILRCLGAGVPQAFAIYLAQGLAVGLAGALAGGALGLATQAILPRVVKDFIPIDLTFSLQWGAALEAMLTGFAICLLFALLPLLAVRRVSPLATIRASFTPPESPGRDPWVWITYAAMTAAVVLFAVAHTRRWREGLGFAAGLGVALVLLSGVAKLLTTTLRRLIPARLPYVVRQGLANLHRPNNRTQTLMLAIGLGTFILLTSHLTRDMLLGQIGSSREGGGANTILFDIQPDQREAVRALLQSRGLPLLGEAPIVTMRLNSIKGRPVEELLAVRTNGIPRWVLRREYRCTYRDQLADAEKLAGGVWIGHLPAGRAANDPVPVSLETGIARDLHVDLGDEIEFDVQGLPLRARVASLREVDWRRVQPNFFMVFPVGVLEDAPAFHVMVTRTESPADSAGLQREVLRQFPTVSAIDVTLILQTVNALLDQVSFVVRFMTLFIVVTGLIVMSGAILTGRFQRLRESVLLRTLGAARGQITRILLVEYLALGLLAAATGAVLALAAGWALAWWVFDTPFVPAPA
ncbi:MAG TPA: FtsX-like permease family protein, partial [Methylomirabilota bacterium]|nr:FtsX-like permease family protein [Methylomirabilota bacterium]